MARATQTTGGPVVMAFIQLRYTASLVGVTEPSEPDERQHWKKKIGVEFSGLERPRDFAIAFAFLLGFILLAAAIAWVVFG